MIFFIIFIILFHLFLFWLWRAYLEQYPSAYYRQIPSKFESMLFWPQFLGIMRGKEPKI